MDQDTQLEADTYDQPPMLQLDRRRVTKTTTTAGRDGTTAGLTSSSASSKDRFHRSSSSSTEHELELMQLESEQSSPRQVAFSSEDSGTDDDDLFSVESLSEDSLCDDDNQNIRNSSNQEDLLLLPPEQTAALLDGAGAGAGAGANRKFGNRAHGSVATTSPSKFSVKLVGKRLGDPLKEEMDVNTYMAQREMTPLQERLNAVTILPNVFFCIYYCWSGNWLSQSLIDQTRNELAAGNLDVNNNINININMLPAASSNGNSWGLLDANGCVAPGASSWSWLVGALPALPPLPVLACAAGIVLHAPWSFLYHWKYAHSLPPGIARIEHWSRRMDHAMIHVASTCASFATSGSWDYLLANLFFNMDCAYRQFKRRVRPRQNKLRIGMSCLAYTIPVLRRDALLFVALWIVFVVSGWLFAKYPLGGWSHSVFHLVIALVPPLLMIAACDLPSSREQMKVAARCLVLAEQQQ